MPLSKLNLESLDKQSCWLEAQIRTLYTSSTTYRLKLYGHSLIFRFLYDYTKDLMVLSLTAFRIVLGESSETEKTSYISHDHMYNQRLTTSPSEIYCV